MKQKQKSERAARKAAAREGAKAKAKAARKKEAARKAAELKMKMSARFVIEGVLQISRDPVGDVACCSWSSW